MTNEEIVGKRILEIYETNSSYEDGFLDSRAHYFKTIIELDNKILFELALHEIGAWNSDKDLIASKGTTWAFENKLEYKNQLIKAVIKRDSNVYYDGSLTLVLANNVIIEHQGTNGDQLFIGRLEDMDGE